jgi:transcriptional regulator of acetoin/glycerol metabolism
VLEERQVTPVGGSSTRAIDVRVVSATHQDLDVALEEERFREDLYFRLKGIEVYVPPLRERREDIGLLADVFLSRSDEVRELAPAARDRLLGHHWPGNVRELEQVLKAASVLCHEGRIEASDIDLGGPSEAPPSYARFLELPLTAAKAELVAEFERASIEVALARSRGNISAAARQLGIHRQSLQQKLKQLGIRSQGPD